MISLVVSVLLATYVLLTISFIRHVTIPTIASKIADRQWRALHPDLNQDDWR